MPSEEVFLGFDPEKLANSKLELSPEQKAKLALELKAKNIHFIDERESSIETEA